jgi:hypothetical protein
MNNNVIESTTAEGVETVNQEGGIYTFRKLNATDTFLMMKIIGKIGVKEFTACVDSKALKEMIASKSNEDADITTAVGISVILGVIDVVLNNLPKCEADIYQMLSNTSNLTIEQVKELDFATFTGMVIEFIKKDEFKDFIKVASRLFK